LRVYVPLISLGEFSFIKNGEKEGRSSLLKDKHLWEKGKQKPGCKLGGESISIVVGGYSESGLLMEKGERQLQEVPSKGKTGGYEERWGPLKVNL